MAVRLHKLRHVFLNLYKSTFPEQLLTKRGAMKRNWKLGSVLCNLALRVWELLPNQMFLWRLIRVVLPGVFSSSHTDVWFDLQVHEKSRKAQSDIWCNPIMLVADSSRQKCLQNTCFYLHCRNHCLSECKINTIWSFVNRLQMYRAHLFLWVNENGRVINSLLI